MGISENDEYQMALDSMPYVEVFSDGGFRKALGTGGYGVIMQCNGQREFIYGGYADCTNNVMELQGVLSALRRLTIPCKVHIVSDSRYVVDAISLGYLATWVNNGWQTAAGKPVANKELWNEIWNLCQVHLVTASWTKGHSGSLQENTICDHLATIGMFQVANQPVPYQLIAPTRL